MACGEVVTPAHKAPGFHRPSTLARRGPLLFQGLSRGDHLLNGRLTTRRGEHGRDRPSRPGGPVKSTLRGMAARRRYRLAYSEAAVPACRRSFTWTRLAIAFTCSTDAARL